MPGERHAAILEAFAADRFRYVHLIGGGGKTTLLFALAHALADAGRSVLTTTTTRILEPEAADSERLILEPDAARLVARLSEEFRVRRHVTAAAGLDPPTRKLKGLDVAVLDAVVDARAADHVLAEADGAAGRSLKAHADHEPVVSARADLVIAVIGVDCLGAPIDDEHVHRAALFRERLGLAVDARLTHDDVAAILLHQAGYLARTPRGAAVFVFINKAAEGSALDGARRIAQRLRARDCTDRLGRIIAGDVRERVFELG